MLLEIMPQAALVIAFLAFSALLVHMFLSRRDPLWQRACQMPLEDAPAAGAQEGAPRD